MVLLITLINPQNFILLCLNVKGTLLDTYSMWLAFCYSYLMQSNNYFSSPTRQNQYQRSLHSESPAHQIGAGVK